MDDADWPRSRSYTIGSLVNWLFFLTVVAFLSRSELPGLVVWSIIGLLTLSVVGQFLAAYRLLARQDEFVRGITAKRVIAAAGLTITIAVAWGLGQQHLDLLAIPLWVVYPAFWGALGIVSPFIRTSRP